MGGGGRGCGGINGDGKKLKPNKKEKEKKTRTNVPEEFYEIDHFADIYSVFLGKALPCL